MTATLKSAAFKRDLSPMSVWALAFGCIIGLVREMVGYPKSDLDPVGYDEIACNAYELNERIVYDDGHYVLTNRENQLIVLYEYPEEEEEVPKVTDKFGNKLSVGDKVIWVDPDPVGRDLNRVYEVNDIHSEETIWINDEFSEAEVPPQELILAKVLFKG